MFMDNLSFKGYLKYVQDKLWLKKKDEMGNFSVQKQSLLEAPLVMIMIGMCLIWPFLDIVAMTSTSISLEITNALTDCDNGYIEIRCVVNGGYITEILDISLRRLDKHVASLTYDGVLEDTEFANRSGVFVNFSISDVGISYLSIKIICSMVKPQEDKGPYQCVLISFGTNYGFIIEKSSTEMLYITDIDCSQQSSKNTYTTVDDIDKGMYRGITLDAIGTAVFGCCIILSIMVIEILVHYCTSADINYV